MNTATGVVTTLMMAISVTGLRPGSVMRPLVPVQLGQGNFNGNGNAGNFNGNGNVGNFNGNGNLGSFRGNNNSGSLNGNAVMVPNQGLGVQNNAPLAPPEGLDNQLFQLSPQMLQKFMVFPGVIPGVFPGR